ncbi:uncharacterized protein LOC128982346 isoform X1 [Macrosteles quadrilineatus]|uniref:uncharacterized protein LOC128982346 isoform X1 n=1 Tax=Macrosteles quadrilineatus TaxID=74068 RepID=UPI0023E1D87C|nr:uncharacterized protein LOC128982346 isoform X1 [Macrosteles quadrilineatus]
MMTRGSILNLLILLIFCSNVSMAKRVFKREPSLNIPKEELTNHIELRKVKNNWMPKGLGEAEGGVLPRFEGSPDDALKIFERKGDKYTFDKQPLASADQLMTDSFGYRKDKESIFILHTIGTDAQHLSVRNVVSALAMRRLIWNEYNLFLFNMPNVMDFMLKHVVRSIFIPAGKTKLQEVGTVLGNFFNSLIVKELINANQIHIVGFCFSSQISGYIGRYVSSYNGGERIKSITALDPFTLGLSGVFNKPVSKDDAQLVHIYHTNSIALGTLYRRGTADFIFNNGWIQPGCYFCNFQSSDAFFKLKNFLPTAKDVPKEEMESKIELRLVDKEWVPFGAKTIQSDDVIPKYLGKLDEAYALFTSEKTNPKYHIRPLADAKDLFKEENGFRGKLESIFIMHTISGDADNYFVRNTITALALRNFLKKYNVFAFDMPELQDSMEQTIAKAMYGQRTNYKDISETIGKFFNTAIADNLLQLDQIHFFGFCYSSQLAGYIGRYLSSTNGGNKIKSITALDPHSAFLYAFKNKVISKDDAQLVFAYHSNSIGEGSLFRKATADFNLNSGWIQPGCYFKRSVMCSHRRAVTAFWYVILYPQLWIARRCSHYFLFKSCLCSFMSKTSLTFPPVSGARGTYYLNTMSHKPYGFGPSGANCISFNREKKSEDIINKN